MRNSGGRAYSALVAAVTRHRVDIPQLGTGKTDACWGAAALLEQLALLRPLPSRNAYFGYSVAIAYIRASGEGIDDSFEPWRDLISDIRALRLTVYDIADRLGAVGQAG